MNGIDLPHSLREFIITLGIEILVTSITYNLTKNLFMTFISIVITLLIIIVVYNLWMIMWLFKESGLKKIHKDSPDPTPMLKQYFSSSKRIQLLAIRGARMLGTDRSLINYIIRELKKDWKGNIEVLLLNPDSDHLKERAEELGHNPVQFARECRSAIQNIFNLKRTYNIDIEVRLYDRKPIIRAIIFDDRALLSYYIGEKGHIPIQYEIRNGENSLLRMINQIYNDLWNESKAAEEENIKGGD